MAPFPMKSFPSLAGEIWHLNSKQKTNSAMSPLFYQSRVGFTCIPKTCQLPQRCHKSAKLMMMAVTVPSSPQVPIPIFKSSSSSSSSPPLSSPHNHLNICWPVLVALLHRHILHRLFHFELCIRSQKLFSKYYFMQM